MNRLFYISTNSLWSGSEELWLDSATQFKIQGVVIFFATKYQNERLSELRRDNYLNYSQTKNSLSQKIKRRLFFIKKRYTDLEKYLLATKTQLVIISQGNNVDSLDIMEFCLLNKIPYITITQLVSEVHLLGINKNNLEKYCNAYRNSLKNFFVSNKNLLLNNVMLGTTLFNATVTKNPCRVYGNVTTPYPQLKDNKYRVALVGRVECFHKGYDLLLDVLASDKWRLRNIEFNLYGDGPHVDVIKGNLVALNIDNMILKGFVDNIGEIWEENHILCMPSRMEGQSLTLIEAMYYGRSAIVTDVGGATELIIGGKNGFVADSATATCLDEALEEAWNKRADWKYMGEECRKIIEAKYASSAADDLNEEIKAILLQ